MIIRPQEFDLCRKWQKVIAAHAAKHNWEPEIIAGIISRESRFGLALDDDLTGDNGHGRGWCQIDDRSFAAWLRSHDWKDPETNIEMGIQVLTGKYNYLNDHGGFDHLSDADAERAAIAAYNCGEGTMLWVIARRLGVDSRTTGGDYSADVLVRASMFKNIFQEGGDQT